MSVDVDLASVHLAIASDDPISQRPGLVHHRVVGPVRDELVELVEGPVVEEEVYPFTSGELAFLVLVIDSLLAAPELGGPVHFVESLFDVRAQLGAFALSLIKTVGSERSL